jgi:hypothetical protein
MARLAKSGSDCSARAFVAAKTIATIAMQDDILKLFIVFMISEPPARSPIEKSQANPGLLYEAALKINIFDFLIEYIEKQLFTPSILHCTSPQQQTYAPKIMAATSTVVI